jgi:RecB family exonuclease
MTMGSILHRVLELVFPEGTKAPAHHAVSAAVPHALDAAIERYASWLSAPVWETERASLLREAQDVAAAWADFLTKTGAEVLNNEIDLSGTLDGLSLAGKADCLLRLPDGRVLVVDHKRSRAANRRDRMAKGWDLQVALYRAMLERPTDMTPLTKLVDSGTRVVTAYHTMLDASVLSDADGAGVPLVETAGEKASSEALAALAELVSEISAGTIRLNRGGDAKRLEKEAGIKAYALKDNPFVAAFTLPSEEGSA